MTRPTSPTASARGRCSLRPSRIEATANMPSGNTIDHSAGSYRSGTRWTRWRHAPAPTSSGICHSAKHQKITTVPPISPLAASTIGTGGIS